ncbi:hypothetical protein [Methylobacterium sp.]|uniref:hypothetical protein n=1 Tax=Methylobacterium sp. TaxID=409 RepID=UPI00258850A2|nr:hypothetical protein [Methylobacterium sp.]
MLLTAIVGITSTHTLACEIKEEDVVKLSAASDDMTKLIAVRQEKQGEFIKRIMEESDKLTAKEVLADYVNNFRYSHGKISPIAKKSLDINDIALRMMQQCFDNKG